MLLSNLSRLTGGEASPSKVPRRPDTHTPGSAEALPEAGPWILFPFSAHVWITQHLGPGLVDPVESDSGYGLSFPQFKVELCLVMCFSLFGANQTCFRNVEAFGAKKLHSNPYLAIISMNNRLYNPAPNLGANNHD